MKPKKTQGHFITMSCQTYIINLNKVKENTRTLHASQHTRSIAHTLSQKALKWCGTWMCHCSTTEPKREHPRGLLDDSSRSKNFSKKLSEKGFPHPLHSARFHLAFVRDKHQQRESRQWLTTRLSRLLFHTQLGSTLKSVFHTVAAFGTQTNPHRFSPSFQTLLTTSPSHRSQRFFRSLLTVSSRFKWSLAIPKLAISYFVTVRRRSHVWYIAYAYPNAKTALSFTAPRFQSESVTRIKHSNKLPIIETFYSHNNGLQSL